MQGTILDKYEILEKVGEGAMACVYRGRHRTLGREVAIKVLHPHLSTVERNRLRFEREAKATEALRHENILEIHDYSGRDSNYCYIITEFIHGMTLRLFLTDHTMPSEVTALVGIELCRALAYAHEKGIVHRDLKPENVMIRQDGHLKLMDFGIARVLDDSKVTVTGGLVGSPAYMSPEQASDGSVGPRSDIFSLGILLYRCVTGHEPFTGGNPPVILRNILEGNYPPPEDHVPDIEPLLSEALAKALALNPDDRFPSARAFGEALSQVLVRAHLPPNAAELQKYFADPDAYLLDLKAHLVPTLLGEARLALEQKQPASAMKILNRLLCLDEGNPEVMALLHDLSRPADRTPPWLKGVGIVIGLALILALMWWMRQDGPVPPAPTLGSTVVNLPATGDNSGAEMPWEDATPTPEPPPPTDMAQPPVVGTEVVAKTRPGPRTNPPRVNPQVGDEPSAILDLRSSPWGEISINGQLTNPQGERWGNTQKPTPISLKAGTYTVRVTNPNCQPREEVVTLTAGRVERRNLSLCARLRLAGLESTWEVLLDGRSLGRGRAVTQPIYLADPPTEHVLEVRRTDGSIYRQTLRSAERDREQLLVIPGGGGS